MREQATEPKPVDRIGDKADWYFEMLGIDLTDGPMSLHRMADEQDATRTSELVAGMWEHTPEVQPTTAGDTLSEWAPEALSTTVSSRRNVRWPVVAIAIIIGATAAFALWWMPQMSEQRASNHAERIFGSLTAVYADMTEMQQALGVVTEPGSGPAELGSVSVNLAAVADSAGRLLAIANEPVPSALPLTPTEPFEELDDIRSGLEPLAAEATAIRSAIAEIADYRLALARVLNAAELPLTADSATITAQGAALAKGLADSVAALSVLPVDGPFAAHRAIVDAEVTAFAQWQDDYLVALRDGNIEETSRLVDELDAVRQMLQTEIVSPLATLRTEIDGRILDLAHQVVNVLATVPQ